jgi:cytochrome c peroxidase
VNGPMRVALLATTALTSPVYAQDRQLIEEGRRIFFEETFEGNGRTCGTCHPATHNFTIDADFIATLPPDNPLFIAENNPALARLENPTLMREFGLILENLEGFDRPPVFRGVPHVLGMTTTITADPEQLGETRDAVGWSGDGAPGAGTLRDFLPGAIMQHFPRTLARVPGEDFRLPTEAELNAVEAFLLSLGRQNERKPLDQITFADGDVDAGKRLFFGEDGANRSCSFCHGNAGSNDDEGINQNFDTGIRRVSRLDLDAFAGTVLPPDGGFGLDPLNDPAGFENGAAGRGDGSFNTPSLIEAADTGPFFHDNSAETIEDAVAFYTGPIFGESPAGGSNPFNFTPTQVDQVAAFLRTMNAHENVANSNRLSAEAQRLRGAEATARIIEVIAETEDAIQVLQEARVGQFRDTIPPLQAAHSLELQALSERDDAQRNRLLAQAQNLKRSGTQALLSREIAS